MSTKYIQRKESVGFCGGALIAAVILVAVYLIFGYRAAHGCSVRMVFVGIVMVLVLLALITVLGRVQ